MVSQAGIQMPVTSHYTFMTLWLMIYLTLSYISIDMPLVHQLEGDQLYTWMNSCKTPSVDIFIYKYNYQYSKVLIILNVLDTKKIGLFNYWLELDPTTASLNAFPPFSIFLIETTTENNIEIYSSFLWISASELNLPGC